MKPEFKIHYNSLVFIKNIVPLIFIGIAVVILAGCTNPDYEKMRGVWEITYENNTKAAFIIENDSVVVIPTDSKKSQEKFKLVLDSGKIPKQFELAPIEKNNNTAPADKLQGIYELSEKTIKAALRISKDGAYPTSFTEQNTSVLEYKGKSTDFTPDDSNYINGLRTWNYWMNLKEISNRSEKLILNQTESATPDQKINELNSIIEATKKMRSEINGLAVSGVDTELTTYVSKFMNNINQLETMSDDSVRLIKDMKSYIAKSNSDETAGRAFFDWLFSNENGVVAELSEEQRELKNRAMSIVNKANLGDEENKKLDAQQLNLRSTLSTKYNREFPQF